MKNKDKIAWSKCCGNRPKVQRDDTTRVWKAQCLMCFREVEASSAPKLVGGWNKAIEEAGLAKPVKGPA